MYGCVSEISNLILQFLSPSTQLFWNLYKIDNMPKGRGKKNNDKGPASEDTEDGGASPGYVANDTATIEDVQEAIGKLKNC